MDGATAQEIALGWGFEDTRFEVTADGNVTLTGDRYELSGTQMPDLLPWLADEMQVSLDAGQTQAPPREPTVPPSRAGSELVAALEAVLDTPVADQARVRLDHAHGQTQQEIYRLNYGDGFERVPDLVVYPQSGAQVEQLVDIAGVYQAVLIPYGGGTNVTDALRCEPSESRAIISVDMRRMNRIEWIDPVNRTAKIQAGAIGRHIVAQLAEFGYTMGHEPDSVEFSTLGGWVATHASGMKKNRYGNIEDIVLDIDVITPAGRLDKQGHYPRESTGFDPKACIFGSEGDLGIVTAAVVRLCPVPQKRCYGSLLFPSLSEGVDFLYDLAQTEDVPASVRLMDNTQFQFGQALQPETTGLASLKSRAEALYVTGVRRFDPDQMVLATLLYEGSPRQVGAQKQMVADIADHYGVGKLRADFMGEIVSKATLSAKQAVKQAVDPHGILAAGNQGVRHEQ